MQTFLPQIGFFDAARRLDTARLGKQRSEVLQLLRALWPGSSAGYRHHPAAVMWRGHEVALAVYGLAVCQVWRIERGHEDRTWVDLHRAAEAFSILNGAQRVPARTTPSGRELLRLEIPAGAGYASPPWLGDLNFHTSHRSSLIRKAPERYGPMWPNTPENMPYLWPRNDGAFFRLFVSMADMKRLADGERVLPDHLIVTDDREVVEA